LGNKEKKMVRISWGMVLVAVTALAAGLGMWIPAPWGGLAPLVLALVAVAVLWWERGRSGPAARQADGDEDGELAAMGQALHAAATGRFHHALEFSGRIAQVIQKPINALLAFVVGFIGSVDGQNRILGEVQ
jgi:uncharacterized membrane protein